MNLKEILKALKELEDDTKSSIEYEKKKENKEMIKILMLELYKIKKAITVLEEE